MEMKNSSLSRSFEEAHSFHSLPKVLPRQIAEYLDQRTAMALAGTCRDFRRDIVLPLGKPVEIMYQALLPVYDLSEARPTKCTKKIPLVLSKYSHSVRLTGKWRNGQLYLISHIKESTEGMLRANGTSEDRFLGGTKVWQSRNAKDRGDETFCVEFRPDPLLEYYMWYGGALPGSGFLSLQHVKMYTLLYEDDQGYAISRSHIYSLLYDLEIIDGIPMSDDEPTEQWTPDVLFFAGLFAVALEMIDTTTSASVSASTQPPSRQRRHDNVSGAATTTRAPMVTDNNSADTRDFIRLLLESPQRAGLGMVCTPEIWQSLKRVHQIALQLIFPQSNYLLGKERIGVEADETIKGQKEEVKLPEIHFPCDAYWEPTDVSTEDKNLKFYARIPILPETICFRLAVTSEDPDYHNTQKIVLMARKSDDASEHVDCSQQMNGATNTHTPIWSCHFKECEKNWGRSNGLALQMKVPEEDEAYFVYMIPEDPAQGSCQPGDVTVQLTLSEKRGSPIADVFQKLRNIGGCVMDRGRGHEKPFFLELFQAIARTMMVSSSKDTERRKALDDFLLSQGFQTDVAALQATVELLDCLIEHRNHALADKDQKDDSQRLTQNENGEGELLFWAQYAGM